MDKEKIIQIEKITFSYKKREVLHGVSFEVSRGEIFGLLGPNGSGKTTLFRILSTAFSLNSGSAKIASHDLATQYARVRKEIGVVFQSPSLDAKLTIYENLIHQGHLYGLSGQKLKERAEYLLKRLGLLDRKKEIVSKLSGGLKRRAELAKGLLHEPSILLLDEPSTALDPGARIELWAYLKELRKQEGVTILVTTHLMEEAEHCDRIAIMSQGQVVSLGTPEVLKREIRGDVIEVKSKDAGTLAQKIKSQLKLETLLIENGVQIEHDDGASLVRQIIETFPGEVESVTVRKPTLEDVYLHHAGEKFWHAEATAEKVSHAK